MLPRGLFMMMLPRLLPPRLAIRVREGVSRRAALHFSESIMAHFHTTPPLFHAMAVAEAPTTLTAADEKAPFKTG